MTEPVEIDDPFADAIVAHVTKHLGPVTNVFHEIQPDQVKLDLLVVGPTDARPYTTLVTCGMSERPMRVPIEDPDDLGRVPELRLAELMLCLPPDWPLTAESFRQPEHFWPIRWLKALARLPHRQGGWLGLGHTIPNGEPPVPFASNTSFCCWLVDEPVLSPPEFQKLREGEGDHVVNFYSAVPLYEEEMWVKLRKGGSALGQLLDRAKVNELIDVRRAQATAGPHA